VTSQGAALICTIVVNVFQHAVFIVDGNRFASVFTAVNTNRRVKMTIGAAVSRFGVSVVGGRPRTHVTVHFSFHCARLKNTRQKKEAQ